MPSTSAATCGHVADQLSERCGGLVPNNRRNKDDRSRSGSSDRRNRKSDSYTHTVGVDRITGIVGRVTTIGWITTVRWITTIGWVTGAG